MKKTVVRGLAVVGLFLIAAVSFRVLVPAAGFEPIGSCIDGDIDLNDPKPFAELKPSGAVVALAASGGGSRAAYLTAAVLRENAPQRRACGIWRAQERAQHT